ncbi:MAG TPA: hypothetical protein VFY17_11130 [Pilimelia sp.]|nr:hypothetical protein [Pilimelia sp.]
MGASWSGRVGPVTIMTVSASAFLAGCADDPVAYCVDRSNIVIADQYCDDDDHTYGWINTGRHKTGVKPGGRLRGGAFVATGDPAARSAAGLPPTGSLAGRSGTSGGFGSGGRSGGFGGRSGGFGG